MIRLPALVRSCSARRTTPILRSAVIQISKVNLRPFASQKSSSVMDTIKSTIAENFTGSHKLVSEEHQFSLDQVPDLSGKVAVVTGGSEGVGYACTHTLLSRNIKKVYILSLSKDIADGALNSLKEEMGEEATKKVTWIHCDLSDWKQTKETADKIASSTDRIDILINNAARGIMTAQLTDKGVDLHMAINHIGHDILTSHLLPVLKKTSEKGDKVRIVNLASNAHQGAPSDTRFETLDEINKDLGPNQQYGRSKLAVLLHARYLAKHVTPEYPNLLANATHPGFVDTRQSNVHIHEPYPLGGYAMSVGMKPFKKDQFEGCVSTMFAATKTTKSGEYVCPPAVPEPGSQMAQDSELGERVMKFTRDLVKEKTYEDSAAKGCPFKDY